MPTLPLDMDRDRRLDGLIVDAHRIMAEAVDKMVTTPGHRLAGVCLLWSGGNDSNVLAHLFRDVANHAVHVNTGIGIEATRQFVRDTAARWGLPLIEEHPPAGSTYEEQVIAHGFPGPAHHWKMYQRLKERALRQVRRRLVTDGRHERVVFLAGRRRSESERRTERVIPPYERVDSVVWVSPLVNWTKLDLNTYRRRFPDTPHNEVSDLLHMSGECLCGAFAKPGELDEIGLWFPDVRAHIERLQDEVRAAGHPAERCRWGWGADRVVRPSRTGPMCSSCSPTLFELDTAIANEEPS